MPQSLKNNRKREFKSSKRLNVTDAEIDQMLVQQNTETMSHFMTSLFVPVAISERSMATVDVS